MSRSLRSSAVALFSLGLASSAAAFGTDARPDANRPPVSGFGFQIPGSATEPSSGQSDASLPVIRRDLTSLPPAVAAMREKIVAAAGSGDYERMRSVIGLSDPPPVLSADGEGDPVEAMRMSSGDPEGLEVLAILLDVLDAGWVVKGEGTPEARYVWPWFAAYPPEALTPPQLVEAYRVLTSGDFEQMRTDGAYDFYRVEIAADGRWLLFMSGE